MDEIDESKFIDGLEARRSLLRNSLGMISDPKMKEYAEELLANSEGLCAELREALANAKESKEHIQQELSAAYQQAEKKLQESAEQAKIIAAAKLRRASPPTSIAAEPELAARLRGEVLRFYKLRKSLSQTGAEDVSSLQSWIFDSEIDKDPPNSSN